MRIGSLVLFASLAGCLGDPHAPCASDAQCREAFGFGQVCGDAGYCEAGALPDRCTSQIAGGLPDVMASPGDYTDGVVLASVHDHNWDVAELRSVRLAALEAVENGGIDGAPIGLIECSYGVGDWDTLDEDGAAAALGEALAVRFGVQGFIGPYTSAQSTALFNAVSSSGAFVISPSATSPSLQDIDGVVKSDASPGLFWRTAPPDSFQGKVAAEDMLDRGRRKVGVVYANDPYGNGLELAFRTRFKDQAGTDVVSLQYADSSQLASAVATLANDDTVEEVFMISGDTADIAAFLNGAGALDGFDDDADAPYPASGKGVFLSDAARDTDLLSDVSSGDVLYEQIRGTAPAAPDNVEYDTFKAAYLARYNDDPTATIYMPYSYDAGWLAVYAAAWSVAQEGAVSGVGMGRGMRRVSDGADVRLLPADWNTARAYFAAGQGVDVRGTSGPLDYDPSTEETATAVDLWTVAEDGAGFVVVETVTP